MSDTRRARISTRQSSDGMFLSFALFVSAFCSSASAIDGNVDYSNEFDEQILIKPLSDGNVYAHIQFTNVWTLNTSDRDAFLHYKLFPKSIGQIINKFNIDELHLTFTQGRWQYDKWGSPIVASPIGAELWVWFQQSSVDTLWNGLINSLSGLSCASLQFMSSSVSSTPEVAFAATNAGKSASGTARSMLRGVLPREMVCTENLTPWLKLLPCGDRGLAHLLHPYRLYDGSYHAQSMRFRRHCIDSSCITQNLELITSISVVMPTRTESNDWSIKSLFGAQQRLERCDLATRSNAFVLLRQLETADDSASATLLTPPKQLLPSNSLSLGDVIDRNIESIAYYDITNDLIIGQQFKQTQTPTADSHDSEFKIRRVVVTGDELLRIELHRAPNDRDSRESIDVTYFDSIAWQMRIYFHTFRCELNGKEVSLQRAPFRFARLIPSEHKSTPNLIEFVVALRRNDALVCHARFERAFLHWTAFPPDAHRGQDLGAGVVEVSRSDCLDPYHWSAHNDNHAQSCARRQYSLGVQFVLPTPDFSMPYNVICLSGTVWALFFGNIFNTLTRRYGQLRQGNEFVSDRPLARLIRFVSNWWKNRKTAAAATAAATSTSVVAAEQSK